MKVKFLGGAEEVGRLGIKMEFKTEKILVDYGVIPEKPPQYPLPPEKVSSIFVTHSHLDHIGALPVYYEKDKPDLYATAMTANSMKPLLNDSIKIMGLEGYPARFNRDDVDSLYGSFINSTYGESFNVGELTVTPYSAGHIPGSTMWRFENGKSVMVTGDLYTRDTKLLTGAKPMKTDILIMESTYAGKFHEDREQVKARLKNHIKEVIDNHGKVILPSFAVGRTQELMMTLSDMDLNIFVDGMGNGITGIYLNTPGFLKSIKDFRKSVGRVRQVRGNGMRQRIVDEADVIITTSGMLDGGPVLFYIQQLMNDPKSAIFLTGYQVEGTNGRSLMENGTINIAGATVKPEMKLEFFDMSAHAGHDDLIEFVKAVDPEKIILCHGDEREKLAKDLTEYDVTLPFNGKEFEVN
ncbi:MBL fold metallo-hydrolase [Oxyplasma meridianum]|uniref:MBL fold metallo-hydrolase n=1 Tax=Oxyplasma meridianum TaxID=3073602 RepID=A0AAX4NGQ2_9ARCH